MRFAFFAINGFLIHIFSILAEKTMEPNIEQLRENYRSFTDDKLISLASSQINSLRPEALEVLKEEIGHRGLTERLSDRIEAQSQQLSIEEFNAYCSMLTNLPCPKCNSSDQPLNATLTAQVMSFIIFTQYQKKVKIACPSCLNKANDRALLLTLIIGWWGIPWGIIRSIQAIFLNLKHRRNNRSTEANDLMKAIVLQNIGNIENAKRNPGALGHIFNTYR